uniref:Wsv045-like protein n=1 Tax=Sicyonia whispovirus TaxID=2984283 RepID=A0A9C7BRB8_9VIRU|nr:MAG: wsv045-like protein [Sicyonia whispovirus]
MQREATPNRGGPTRLPQESAVKQGTSPESPTGILYPEPRTTSNYSSSSSSTPSSRAEDLAELARLYVSSFTDTWAYLLGRVSSNARQNANELARVTWAKMPRICNPLLEMVGRVERSKSGDVTLTFKAPIDSRGGMAQFSLLMFALDSFVSLLASSDFCLLESDKDLNAFSIRVPATGASSEDLINNNGVPAGNCGPFQRWGVGFKASALQEKSGCAGLVAAALAAEMDSSSRIGLGIFSRANELCASVERLGLSEMGRLFNQMNRGSAPSTFSVSSSPLANQREMLRLGNLAQGPANSSTPAMAVAAPDSDDDDSRDENGDVDGGRVESTDEGEEGGECKRGDDGAREGEEGKEFKGERDTSEEEDYDDKGEEEGGGDGKGDKGVERAGNGEIIDSEVARDCVIVTTPTHTLSQPQAQLPLSHSSASHIWGHAPRSPPKIINARNRSRRKGESNANALTFVEKFAGLGKRVPDAKRMLPAPSRGFASLFMRSHEADGCYNSIASMRGPARLRSILNRYGQNDMFKRAMPKSIGTTHVAWTSPKNRRIEVCGPLPGERACLSFAIEFTKTENYDHVTSICSDIHHWIRHTGRILTRLKASPGLAEAMPTLMPLVGVNLRKTLASFFSFRSTLGFKIPRVAEHGKSHIPEKWNTSMTCMGITSCRYDLLLDTMDALLKGGVFLASCLNHAYFLDKGVRPPLGTRWVHQDAMEVASVVLKFNRLKSRKQGGDSVMLVRPDAIIFDAPTTPQLRPTRQNLDSSITSHVQHFCDISGRLRSKALHRHLKGPGKVELGETMLHIGALGTLKQNTVFVRDSNALSDPLLPCPLPACQKYQSLSQNQSQNQCQCQDPNQCHNPSQCQGQNQCQEQNRLHGQKQCQGQCLEHSPSPLEVFGKVCKQEGHFTCLNEHKAGSFPELSSGRPARAKGVKRELELSAEEASNAGGQFQFCFESKESEESLQENSLPGITAAPKSQSISGDFASSAGLSALMLTDISLGNAISFRPFKKQKPAKK